MYSFLLTCIRLSVVVVVVTSAATVAGVLQFLVPKLYMV